MSVSSDSTRRPRVSVGMPVYNSATFVADSIGAILRQTFADFELLILDNASTDRTPEICRQFAAADTRVRYERNATNIGAPRNYNAVLGLARADLFKWCAANDLCGSRFLEACVATLDAHPDAVLAYPKTILFDSISGSQRDYEDNLSLGDPDPVTRYRQCHDRLQLNNAMNGVFRTRALRSSTLHRSFPGSDMVLMPELALYGKFVEVPERLFLRRMDSNATYGKGSPDKHRAYYPEDRLGPQSMARGQARQMFAGVSRAPVSWVERLRLYGYVSRRTWRMHRVILGLG